MVRSKREKRKRGGEPPDSPEDPLINDSSSFQNSAPSNLITKKFATSAKVLHMNELQVVFHLPMAEAAVKLGVCSTVLKKICRRNGISRWPYRQIRKIDKAIEELEQSHSSKSGTDDRAANDLQFKINSLKKLRAQIIDNPEIDRSNELGSALSDKVIGDDGISGDYGGLNNLGGLRSGGLIDNTSASHGLNRGLNLHNSLQTTPASTAITASSSNTSNSLAPSINVSNSSGLSTSSLTAPLTSSTLTGVPRGLVGNTNNIAPGSANGINGKNLTIGIGVGGGGNGALNNGGAARELMDGGFPLESYNPANLKTVFPRDIIAEDGEEGYGFGGSLGLVDVSWNDNADPCTGMMLYRGENYEWLASHAAVVRGDGVSSGGVDVLDGGPINDSIRTRQQNRISVDRGLCPILPPIDVSDMGKLTKSDLLFALDSDVIGPFDTEECRAGITIW